MIKSEHLTDAVICREQESVLEVSRILRDTQRRHLIVLNTKDQPVGVISSVDLNNRVLAEEKDPKKIQAHEIMTKGVRTVSLQDTYEKAFQIMIELGTYSIPVLRQGKLLGVLEFTKAFKLKELEAANHAQHP
ncbi:CBS domain-containing protein [Candidatus Woesearchaeota archaeon]|nr:CBS domain-containing protein [Candidatus Woesearchaeota archaeon]